MNTISVLIRSHAGPTGEVLVCKTAGSHWELPHGTQRTGETPQQAAERIAWEQLSMKITVGSLQMTGHKAPQDGYVEHIVCGNITHNTHTKCDYHHYYDAVDLFQTGPKIGAYTEFQWVHPSELGGVGLTGDDGSFVAKYGPWINGRTIPDVRMP